MAMPREWGAKFYTSGRWLEVRYAYMTHTNWACERCESPAEICHHIEHITTANCNDPFVLYGWNNLEALCRECHEKEHNLFRGGREPITAIIKDGRVTGDRKTPQDIIDNLII